MFKFKQLVWNLSEDGTYCWAKSPAGHDGQLTMHFEEGRWWTIWDFTLDGVTGDLEELQRHGQTFHENYLKQFLETA